MAHFQVLQQLHRYHGAGLGVSEGVMVVHEVIAAGCGDGLELMVGEPATEVAAGSCEGVVELIVRIVHLVNSMYRLQAAFVKTGVVRNEGESLD